MYGVSRYNISYPNNSTYSPVTLSDEWPKVGRLILLVTLSAIGTTLNGFFVSSFFVERTLRRPGLVFLACMGLADMIVTSVIMPAATVILLSGEWDNISVCNALQWFGVSAVYCYSLIFLSVAVEDYLRVCCSKKAYEFFVASKVAFITILIFVISFFLGAIGVYLGLDYDYCLRVYPGNVYFRAISMLVFHILPSILTVYCLISSYVRIRRRASCQLSYRRSQAYSLDNSLALINIIAYVVFFIAWLPYLITSLDLNFPSDAKYYNSIWVGLGRTVVTSILYSSFNRNFRRAFSHIFNYCCCKSGLSRPLVPRHRKKYCTRVNLMQRNNLIGQRSQMRTTRIRDPTPCICHKNKKAVNICENSVNVILPT